MAEHFSVGPPPNRTCGFHRIRLSSGLCLRLRFDSPVVDVQVARPADHEGLALPCRHDLHPLGLFPLAFHVQVAKCADVVDFYVHRGVAHFAFVRQEPFDKLVAVIPVPLRLSVYENCLPSPLQGYATELRHLRALPIALFPDNL